MKQPTLRIRRILVDGTLILMSVCVVGFCAVPNFLDAQNRARVAQWENAARHLSAGIEAYLLHHGKLPTPGPPVSTHRFAKKNLPTQIQRLTTLMDADTLSTEAFIYYDPFTPELLGSHAPHLYFPDAEASDFLLISAGPDRDYDFDPGTDLYKSRAANLSSLIMKAYDPSNGTLSGGDLIWTRKGNLRELLGM